MSALLPAPTVEQTVQVDPFDVDAVAWARSCRDELIELAKGQEKRREDNESQDRIGAATIAKLYDTAIKFERYAAERHDKIAEVHHDRELMDHERQMAGLGRRAG